MVTFSKDIFQHGECTCFKILFSSIAVAYGVMFGCVASVIRFRLEFYLRQQQLACSTLVILLICCTTHFDGKFI